MVASCRCECQTRLCLYRSICVDIVLHTSRIVRFFDLADVDGVFVTGCSDESLKLMLVAKSCHDVFGGIWVHLEQGPQ